MSVAERAAEVYQALDASIVYAEYRGNLRRARQCAVDALRTAPDGSEAWAAAVLDRATVHILQGEPLAAQRLLAEVAGRSQQPEDALLAMSLDVLALRVSAILLPDGGGRPLEEIEASWSVTGRWQQEQEAWRETAVRVPAGAVRLKAALAFHLLSNLPFSLGLALGRDFGTEEQRARRLRVVSQPVSQFLAECELSAAGPRSLASAQRFYADLHHYAGEASLASEALSRAEELYRQTDDLHGVGLCRMQAADQRAAPFTSPVLWNHALVESAIGQTLSGDLWEDHEYIRGAPDPHTVEPLYQEAEAMFRGARSGRGLAALALRRAYLAVLAGRRGEARRWLVRARRLFAAFGDVLGERLAAVHEELVRLGAEGADVDLASAERLARWGRERGLFAFTWGLAQLFNRVGRSWWVLEADYERAERHHRFAERLQSALGAEVSAANSAYERAALSHTLRERSAARVGYEEALRRFESLRSHPRLGLAAWQRAVLTRHAICHLWLERQEAGWLGLETRRLSRLWDEGPRGGGSDLFTGTPGVLAGLIEWSLPFFFAASEFLRAVDAREAGDDERLAEAEERALARAEKIPSEQRDMLIAAIHRVDRSSESARRAFVDFMAVLDAGNSFADGVAQGMAAAFGQVGERVVRRQPLHALQHEVAFYARVRDFETAGDRLARLEEAAGVDWWRDAPRPWEQLGHRAEIHEGLGRLGDAAFDYARVVDLVESWRGRLFQDAAKVALVDSNRTRQLFFAAARCSLRRDDLAPGDGHGATAFRYVERGKARALADLVAASSPALADRPELRSYRRATTRLQVWLDRLASEQARLPLREERIEQLKARILGAERALEPLESRVETALSSVPSTPILGPDEIAGHLEPGHALLQYVFDGGEMLAWAVASDGAMVSRRITVEAAVLNREVRRLCAASRDPDGELGRSAGVLGELFLDPLAEVVAPAEHLIVVPYGAAHRLPFSLLLWEGEQLIAGRSVSTLPSASLLALLPASGTSRPEKLLAVGDPANMSLPRPGDGALVLQSALPYATLEVEAVAGRFPGSRLLLGQEATRAELLRHLPSHRWLHVATHGVLDEESPLSSSLLLADGEALSVIDLMGLSLDVEMAVLSGCETGLGRGTRGDDLLGLLRGVLAAGCRSAVVSLWPVSDFSTCLLMDGLYAHLAEGRPPADAMRRAQLRVRGLAVDEVAELRETWRWSSHGERLRQAEVSRSAASGERRERDDLSHPYYWAPFIVVGRR